MAVIIGIALSVASGFVVVLWENRHAAPDFTTIAENKYLVLHSGLNAYFNKIMTLPVSFESSDGPVSGKESETFASPYVAYDSAVETLPWVPRVRRNERATYENSRSIGAAGAARTSTLHLAP